MPLISWRTTDDDLRSSKFSFLAMAGSEFLPSIAAAAVAACVFVAVHLSRGDWTFGWLVGAPLAVFIGASFWGWLAANRRLRTLEDVPLSRIASAAQGYARIEGRAASFPDQPTRSPITQRECCWYSYEFTELAEDGDPKSRETDTSEWSFMLRDGSGECVVDPVGARIVSVRVKRWSDRTFRYVERAILPGDELVVMGQFSTSGSGLSDYDLRERVGRLVTEWKRDMPRLVRRFDLDGNRELSLAEWERVRAAAFVEVQEEIAKSPPRAQNRIERSAEGRPFIISAQSTPQLERDLKIWAWLHLASVLGGVGSLAYFLLRLR